VLFSNETIAQLINDQFEPVWESVRPVPQVTVDFGNGTIVKRTLHGNVATYACTASGRVIDVLPGIYEPESYGHALKQMTELHHRDRINGRSNPISIFHRQRLALLRAEDLTPVNGGNTGNALTLDTRYNQQVRRRAVHEYLSDWREIKPDQMKLWLYREVLQADLEDPYLGLGHALFADYPFAEEDR
jgi:hypothetical protein